MNQEDNRSSMAPDDLPDVCVVTQPLSSAGESVTRSLLEILSAITAVSLVTPSMPLGSDLRDRYDVVEFGRAGTGVGVVVPAIRFARNQIEMAKAVRYSDEEIALFFGATSYVLPILVAKLSGKSVVLEPRGDVPLTLRLYWERRVPSLLARALAGVVWLLERFGFWVADAIVTYTPGVAEQLDLGGFGHKLHTDGARYIDTDVFYSRVPFERRKRVVGFLGRLDEEKGVRTLAAVAKLLSEDVTFRFIGDGDLRGWLVGALEEEITAGHVEIAGWVSRERVPIELSGLRLLIMPSAPTEGLPTTILEAMACETPVYATPVSGVPDVVRDGETGFLMQELEPDSIQSDLESLLGREDLAEISAECRELIRSEYSFDAACRRYTRIIRAVSGD